ncbi:MAG: hypothetical protein ABR564_02805 [Candidatus Dormibacteria bacterium]
MTLGRPAYGGVAAVASLLVAGGLALALGLGPHSGGGESPRQGREVPATAMDMVAMNANNSPQLVADPADRQFVALANRVDGPQFGCALQVSYDGGHGWLSARPVPALPSGVERCYAPVAAFDRSSRLYYLFVGLAGTGNSPVGVFLTTSTNRGAGFTAPRQILGREHYMVRMALDPDTDRMHLVWLEARTTPPTGGFAPPPNPIMSAFSNDRGETFSRPVQVSDPGRQRVVAPVLGLGADRQVHVLYYDLGSDVRDYEGLEGPPWEQPWSLVLSTSRDGGAHFSPGVVVDGDVIPPQRVMLIYTMPPAAMAVDHDNVYVSWHDARNRDWDVFLRRSTDGGRSFSAPIRVNDDRRGDGRNEYLPQLAVSPEGRLDLLFYDRRNDPDNIGSDVYYTYSTDGGRSVAPNRRLTSLASNSLVGPHYAVTSARGLVETGGRIALLSEGNRALAA